MYLSNNLVTSLIHSFTITFCFLFFTHSFCAKPLIAIHLPTAAGDDSTPPSHLYYAGSAVAPIRTPWYPWAQEPFLWNNWPPRLPFWAPSMILRSKFWKTPFRSLFTGEHSTTHWDTKHKLYSLIRIIIALLLFSPDFFLNPLSLHFISDLSSIGRYR